MKAIRFHELIHSFKFQTLFKKLAFKNKIYLNNDNSDTKKVFFKEKIRLCEN